MEIRDKVIESCNKMGMNIDKLDENEDIDLREFIIDSTMFISFIMQLEIDLDIEIPDTLLQIEKFSSLNSFSKELEDI